MTCFVFVCFFVCLFVVVFFDGGGINIPRGGKWGARGRETGGEGEGSGGKEGGKRGLGTPSLPPVHPHSMEIVLSDTNLLPSL